MGFSHGHRQATRGTLTGLPNRFPAKDRLGQNSNEGHARSNVESMYRNNKRVLQEFKEHFAGSWQNDIALKYQRNLYSHPPESRATIDELRIPAYSDSSERRPIHSARNNQILKD